jgi:hypothetical protein
VDHRYRKKKCRKVEQMGMQRPHGLTGSPDWTRALPPISITSGRSGVVQTEKALINIRIGVKSVNMIDRFKINQYPGGD